MYSLVVDPFGSDPRFRSFLIPPTFPFPFLLDIVLLVSPLSFLCSFFYFVEYPGAVSLCTSPVLII